MFFIPLTPISMLAKSHLGITLISWKGAAQLSKALKRAKNKWHSNIKWELRGRKLNVSSASGIAAVWNRTCRCGVFPLLILSAYFFPSKNHLSHHRGSKKCKLWGVSQERSYYDGLFLLLPVMRSHFLFQITAHGIFSSLRADRDIRDV